MVLDSCGPQGMFYMRIGRGGSQAHSFHTPKSPWQALVQPTEHPSSVDSPGSEVTTTQFLQIPPSALLLSLPLREIISLKGETWKQCETCERSSSCLRAPAHPWISSLCLLAPASHPSFFLTANPTDSKL